MRLGLYTVGFIALLASIPTASAGLITPTAIKSGDVGANVQMEPLDAISGSGLNEGTGSSDQPALSGTHSNTWNDHWWSNSSTGQITIDLGGNYAIEGIHIWNYNEGSGGRGRGIQNGSFWVAPDDNEANLVKLVTSGTGLHDNGTGDFLLPQSTALATYLGFDLDLGGISNAALLNNVRLFRVQGIDTYGQSTNGLGEIQFDGTVVPEPASLTLLLLSGWALFSGRRTR